MSRAERWLLVGAILIGLGIRLALIWTYPDNFSMDGYQRWAGREHLLVQDWLPATQSVIHAISWLGGGILQMRIGLAIVATLAIAAGALVARELGGLMAGWLFIPLALFGPFLTWSVVPYQEGTYLLCVLGAVALVLRASRLQWPADHRGWLIADLLAGCTALVRYEGWVFVALYLMWRRDTRALRAAWGIAFWLGVKASGAQGYAASPIDFADWEGLSSRYRPAALTKTLQKFGRHCLDTGLPALAAVGLAGGAILWRKKAKGVTMLMLIFGLQLAATLGWMIGLETATYRMQAIMGVMLALLAASAAGLILQRQPRWKVVVAGVIAVGLGAHFVLQGFDNARRSTRSAKWERKLVRQMTACTDCTWAITPRRRIGTRKRHDGCEIIQGLSEFQHGEDFWCTSWPGRAPFIPTHKAKWKKGGYVVEGP